MTIGDDPKVHQPAFAQFVREEVLTREELQKATSMLRKNKVLDWRASQVKGSNVHSSSGKACDVHVRDNMFLAHSLYASDVDGSGTAAAIAIVSDVAVFLLKTAARFDDIIGDHADAKEPMSRPHVRFNGATLDENGEYWNHMCNDALGYFMWIRCRLCYDGKMRMTGDHLRLLGLMLEYLLKVEYWQDEDCGHWGETPKIQASSIGAVVAGSRELRKLLDKYAGMIVPCADGVLDEVEERGKEALESLLPKECAQAGKERSVDAALLFLIYPLCVVEGDLAKAILKRVEDELVGKVGVRRYNGDGFWCKDFKERLQLPEDISCICFSDQDIEMRRTLAKPGEEAQWTIFDPILSIIYGDLYKASSEMEDLKTQQYYLGRSLAQVTGSECQQGAWHLPGAYYLRRGKWVPNDACPCLWTQANLDAALFVMDRSLAASTEQVRGELRKFEELGTGAITLDDLVTVLVRLNEDLPADDLLSLLSSFADERGKVNFEGLVGGLFSGQMATPARASFNLQGMRPPASMSPEELAEAERVVTDALLELHGDLGGEYFPMPKSQSFCGRLGGMTKKDVQALESSGLMFRARACEGRGVFANNQKDLAVFLNSDSHLEVLVKPDLGDHSVAPARLSALTKVLGDMLKLSGTDLVPA